jgi:hypothetical protein
MGLLCQKKIAQNALRIHHFRELGNFRLAVEFKNASPTGFWEETK